MLRYVDTPKIYVLQAVKFFAHFRSGWSEVLELSRELNGFCLVLLFNFLTSLLYVLVFVHLFEMIWAGLVVHSVCGPLAHSRISTREVREMLLSNIDYPLCRIHKCTELYWLWTRSINVAKICSSSVKRAARINVYDAFSRYGKVIIGPISWKTVSSRPNTCVETRIVVFHIAFKFTYRATFIDLSLLQMGVNNSPKASSTS